MDLDKRSQEAIAAKRLAQNLRAVPPEQLLSPYGQHRLHLALICASGPEVRAAANVLMDVVRKRERATKGGK